MTALMVTQLVVPAAAVALAFAAVVISWRAARRLGQVQAHLKTHRAWIELTRAEVRTLQSSANDTQVKEKCPQPGLAAEGESSRKDKNYD